ncbi:NAD kinase associated with ferric reductase [Scheffersomyces xylosifermentans]|uniref:NAD kinase associated with ferric reductase n=1 Tax=Scheffersomyces xylosifermentans TaxID=1304137 RepID=UPI00315C5ED5
MSSYFPENGSSKNSQLTAQINNTGHHSIHNDIHTHTTAQNIPMSNGTTSASKRASRGYGTVITNNHTIIPNISSSGTSPNGYISREGPMIHNKLYCEQVKAKKVTSSVLSKLSNDDLRSVKSHTELAETANGVRMLAKNLSKATIQLDVRAIMIVTKARDNSLIYLTREVVEWLLTQDRDITVYVDSKLENSKRFRTDDIKTNFPKANGLLRFWDKKFALKNPEEFDLVVTLGGDGTVLYASNLFQRVVPPVISFALGSLGFLTNFKFDSFRERMNTVLASGVKAYLRMRFTCRVHRADGKLVCEQQVLNELVVDRGPSPYVTQLELYGDGSLLTIAQADGLIIATPTGSTAYSLSAGGSLVHPGVSAISVTPICPHTLSFRPILLPDGMFLKVKVPETSRSTAWASFDGKVRTELNKGDYVTIQASPFPFPTVISSKTEYIDSVSRNLNWNAREQQKPFSHLLSDKNQRNLRETTGGVTESLENLHIETNNDDEYDINYTSDSSSTPSDTGDEDSPYIPSPGNGINTPPPGNSFGGFEGTCFAHPHARITLDSSSTTSTSNSTRYSSSTSTGSGSEDNA